MFIIKKNARFAIYENQTNYEKCNTRLLYDPTAHFHYIKKIKIHVEVF